MAVPPTLVNDVESAFNTATTPKTAAVGSVVLNDIIVVDAVMEQAAQSFSTPTGSSLTYTSSHQTAGTSVNGGRVGLWTAPVTSSISLTTSVARAAGALQFGQSTSAWRGSDGVGAANGSTLTAGTAAPNLALTTTGANSAIVFGISDWTGTDMSAATWRQINGANPVVLASGVSSGIYSWVLGYYADSGAAGAQAVGFTAPSAVRVTIAAVEIFGWGAGQQFLPDADTVTTGWTATPLYSKLNDGSDATVVTATLA